MNTYNIDDYIEFTNAMHTAQNSQDIVNEKLINIYNEITNLDSSEVFVGPICNNVLEEMDNINSQIKQDIFYINNITSFLNSVKTNYQSSDSSNSKDIGGV